MSGVAEASVVITHEVGLHAQAVGEAHQAGQGIFIGG